MTNTLDQMIESWAIADQGVYSTEELLAWIAERNRTVQVQIDKIPFNEQEVWQYFPEEGVIGNAGRSFFTISGCENGGVQQPIILQNEIGYLGIICKEINGVLHFLMQAKIEPGNINKIQISPTIQATKSNFTQAHGGKKPPYLDFFLHEEQYEIVVDQIQSEQSSRFLGKRNRNTVIPMCESHRWMTLGQIKALMKRDNLVNMDTRTVISCLPIFLADPKKAEAFFADSALYRSIFLGDDQNSLPGIYRFINTARMFREEKTKLIPLGDLKNWEYQNGELVCRDGYHFKVVCCNISMEGREVKQWIQPLFEATGIATFGLLCCEEQGVLKFLVRAREEIGSFDGPELGPTVQREADEITKDTVEECFFRLYNKKENVLQDVVLSEEGGRFYHEQNRNIVIRAAKRELPELPEGYFLVDYKTLNQQVQVNNCLNIQLRNLLSLLEI
ncbi:MAG: NDP-hexose 2,3-dehydratase family protein [Oscillospiraceae bacterium]